ncbi:MAG: hypothetical protein WBN44_00130 [Woeseiaceae bacterium]
MTAAIFLIAIAAVLLTSLRFFSDDPKDASDVRSNNGPEEINDRDDDPAIYDPPATPTETLDGESAPCLTLEQLEGHPVVAQDAYRYEAVIDSGPVIAAYRGLSEQELQDLAGQGDSAAMAVLGAMSIMRARDLPEDKAVSFLMFEDPALLSFTFSRPFSPEFIDHMTQARQWFYKAALHGRVMVLYRVGGALVFEQGGPVELGWIGKEEYDGLSTYEKTALDPSNVYNVLAYEVAPGLKSGPNGELVSTLMPRTERQKVIVDELVAQFERDLQDAALPPIVVSESSMPSLDELILLLCDSERQRLEELKENVR